MIVMKNMIRAYSIIERFSEMIDINFIHPRWNVCVRLENSVGGISIFDYPNESKNLGNKIE